jgi:hypothetical protein
MRRVGETASAACLSFLVLLGVGAVIVAAAKLQFPSLGKGASPLDVLRAIVIVALGSLGATVRLGGLGVSVVPLGAMALVSAGIAWATKSSLQATPSQSLVDGARDGALLGPFLGLLCAVAAAIFKLDGGTDPVSVSVTGAGVLGTLWGSVFGALGGMLRSTSLRGLVSVRAESLSRFNPSTYLVLESSVICLGLLVAGGVAAVLGSLVYRLASSPLPPGFDAGDAVAGTVYLIAFLPNVVAAVLAVAMGGGVDVGAEVSAAGERIGPLLHYSLSSWGGGDPSPLVYALLAIPVCAFTASGYLIAARCRDPARTAVGLAGSAAVVTVVLGLLWIVGDARLGGGLVSGHGVAKVAVAAAEAVPLAFGWALGMGLVGWALHETMRRGTT